MIRVSNRMLRRCLCILVLSSAVHAPAQETKAPSTPRAALKKKQKPQPLQPKKKAAEPVTPDATGVTSQFGIGFGLFSVFLPQPTFEGLWRYGALVLSSEAGLLPLSGKKYAASTSYLGLAGRYLVTPSFYAGLGIGSRRIMIMTETDMVVGDVATPVKWTRTSDQMVLTPKVGWEFFSEGTSFLISLGILVPSGSRFATKRNVATVDGLTDEEMAAEEEKKGNDVRKVTSATSPYVEVKYAWYF